MPSPNLEDIRKRYSETIKEMETFVNKYACEKKYIPNEIKGNKKGKGKQTRKRTSGSNILKRKIVDAKNNRQNTMYFRRFEQNLQLSFKRKKQKQNQKPRLIVVLHGGNDTNRVKHTYYVPNFNSLSFYANSDNILNVDEKDVPYVPNYVCSGYVKTVETIAMKRQAVFEKKGTQKVQLKKEQIGDIECVPLNINKMTFNPSTKNDSTLLKDCFGIYYCNPKKKILNRLLTDHNISSHEKFKKNGMNIETLMILLHILNKKFCKDIPSSKMDVHIFTCRIAHNDNEEVLNLLHYLSSNENSSTGSKRSFRSGSSGKMSIETRSNSSGSSGKMLVD